MEKCFFCENIGGELLFTSNLFRVILVEENNYPGYIRIVLNKHVKELSDLSDDENIILYKAVMNCEKIIRKILRPEKINIASFGNMTPHVHWHIIPRFKDDTHFPNPNWGAITNPDYVPSSGLLNKLPQLITEIKQTFN